YPSGCGIPSFACFIFAQYGAAVLARQDSLHQLSIWHLLSPVRAAFFTCGLPFSASVSRLDLCIPATTPDVVHEGSFAGCGYGCFWSLFSGGADSSNIGADSLLRTQQGDGFWCCFLLVIASGFFVASDISQILWRILSIGRTASLGKRVL